MKKIIIAGLVLVSVSAFANNAVKYECKSEKFGKFKIIFVANDYTATLISSSGNTSDISASINPYSGTLDGSSENGKTRISFQTRATGLGTVYMNGSIDNVICGVL